MAKRGTITLTGETGQKYEFNIYSWGTRFNDFGAVYYISKRTKKPDGALSHSAIYIGQTSDMSERFDNHHDTDCFKEHGANAISVHKDGNEKSRLEKEADLIGAYDPPCNG